MSTVQSMQAAGTVQRPVRVEASGTSPDEAMATLPGLYAGKHWYSRRTDHPFSYRYSAVGDEDLTFRRSVLDGFLRGSVCTGDGDYVVYWLTRGTVVLDTHRDPIVVTPMRPHLSPEGEEFVFETQDYDTRLVHLGRDLVHDVAAERAGEPVDTLHFDVRRPPDGAALARWRNAMAGATASVGDRTAAPLAWHRATRSVAAAFLGLWSPPVETVHPALRYPRNARVRAAVEHVHAHAAQPLTVAEIAAAAGMSTRSTQEAFQRVLGVTPMQYVQQHRMERVRADLLEADPATTTVAQVARRWGYLHVGRFSGAYRARFGEFPRDSLHR